MMPAGWKMIGSFLVLEPERMSHLLGYTNYMNWPQAIAVATGSRE